VERKVVAPFVASLIIPPEQLPLVQCCCPNHAHQLHSVSTSVIDLFESKLMVRSNDKLCLQLGYLLTSYQWQIRIYLLNQLDRVWVLRRSCSKN